MKIPGYILILFFVFFSLYSVAGAAVDLTRIAAGPRVIAMGRAGVALSQDSASSFVNPAGVARTSQISLQSMYTKLFDEVGYNTASGILPTNFGNFGLGYTRAGVNDLYNTSMDPLTGRGKIDSNFNYSDSLYVLSYARSFSGKLFLGASLKYEQQAFAAAGRKEYFDLDLGAQYAPNSTWQIGLFQSNLLPAAGGETLDGSTKVGVGCQVNPSVLMVLDLENTQNKPLLWHAGMEWSASDNLKLRGGLDQAAKGKTESILNLAAGIGLKTQYCSFDYAYYLDRDPGNQVDSYGAHMFSFSLYLPEGESTSKKTEEIVLKDHFHIKKIAWVRVAGRKIKLVIEAVDEDDNVRSDYNGMACVKDRLGYLVGTDGKRIDSLAVKFKNGRYEGFVRLAKEWQFNRPDVKLIDRILLTDSEGKTLAESNAFKIVWQRKPKVIVAMHSKGRRPSHSRLWAKERAEMLEHCATNNISPSETVAQSTPPVYYPENNLTAGGNNLSSYSDVFASSVDNDLGNEEGRKASISGTPVNYPNPFNPAVERTKISYTLTKDIDITISIFDMTGQPVWSRTVLAGNAGAKTGYNEAVWDGQDAFGAMVGSGVYFCRIIGKVDDRRQQMGKINIAVLK